VELLPTYKAHRVVAELPTGPDVEEVPDPLEVQVPVILEVLDAFGICVRGFDGYEADDVIGTLATGAGGPVDVVTGDRDLFQVVDDAAGVRVLYIARGVGNHERVDNGWVRSKYGIDAAQYADFATLRGDASDGLPGVAGIGEKTAATLLNRYGDMAGIVAAAHDPGSDMGPGPRGKIKAAEDYLLVAPQVVAVARDLELDRTGLDRPVTPRDPAAVAELARRYNLESPAARLVEALMR
jgi:5'-3' exonuclease